LRPLQLFSSHDLGITLALSCGGLVLRSGDVTRSLRLCGSNSPPRPRASLKFEFLHSLFCFVRRATRLGFALVCFPLCCSGIFLGLRCASRCCPNDLLYFPLLRSDDSLELSGTFLCFRRSLSGLRTGSPCPFRDAPHIGFKRSCLLVLLMYTL